MERAEDTLNVTVINGDLTFVHQPLLLGHYRSLKLTGTERVMDGLVGGVMADGLTLGIYPGAPGTSRVFMNTGVNPFNPRQLPRPEAVIIVGLGDEGKLTPSALVETVRHGVLAWAHRGTERPGDRLATGELAATLIGSGGTGVSAGQAAQLIVQGVAEARQRLAEFNAARHEGREWPTVNTLHLIELYLDRATEAWRALRLQAEAAPGQFTVAEVVHTGTGALARPLDPGYRGADYDLISALTHDGPAGESSIAYTLDTKRARTEVRAQVLQQRLVRSIVATASTNANALGNLGRSLFNMLVPVEMRPFLSGNTEMLLELDDGTAGIPWELLDSDAGTGGDPGMEPWAIRAKLLRKLRVANPPTAAAPDTNAEASVLVIGEPACDRSRYPELPGARAEANAVAELLSGRLEEGAVESLIGPEDQSQTGPDARTVITTLLERGWRIVHISAHGEGPLMVGPEPLTPDDPPQRCVDPRGVVLSGNTYLGPNEIRTMPAVPELVFVNCCHLARSSADVLHVPSDRASFAAGVATELIGIGVRCVIAAGWAVDDEAASTFATTFYDRLVQGDRFIDAVARARTAARAKDATTWAAYQCYGDPDWRFRTVVGDAQRPAPALSDTFAGIGSAAGLKVALETIAVQSRFQKADPGEQTASLEHLEERFARYWGELGDVAEAFGLAWSELRNWTKASEWYERAIVATDASASIKAMEQAANMRARKAWDMVDGARSAKHDVKKTVKVAREQVNDAIALLDRLESFGSSMERESLYGSAYKRLAMIEEVAGDARRGEEAVREMKRHYAQATTLGRKHHPLGFSYPALNEIAADVILNAGRRETELSDDLVAATRKCLETKAETDPDFWSVLGQTELKLYEVLATEKLSDGSTREEIERQYDKVHQRVSAARMWASVYDTACFVLPRYGSRASAAERDAATALLTHLGSLVQPAPASD
jgi:tetratricopeptide (TPR) repeat protein